MEWIKTYWGLVVGIVAFVAWLVRLEAKIIMQNKIFEIYKLSFEEHRNEEKIKMEKLEKTIEKIFDLMRDIQSTLDEFRGWKNSLKKD